MIFTLKFAALVLLVAACGAAYRVTRRLFPFKPDLGEVSGDWVHDYRCSADKDGWTHGVPFQGKFKR